MKDRIKNKAYSLLFAKRSGDATLITGIFTVIITLLVFIIAIYSFALWQGRMMKIYDIELVAHRYLMQMEITDFSNMAEINSIYDNLTAELTEYGVTGIDYEGSTDCTVTNGEKIVLHIKGRVSLKNLSLGNSLTVINITDRQFEIDIEKQGTAMY